MTNEHTSLENYTSHILFEMVAKGLRKGFVWEVSWRLNRDCNILTPISSIFSSTSFSFCWAAQRGGGWGHSPLLRAGSHCLELQQLTPNWLNFLSHRVISLFDIHLLLVSVATAPNSTCLQSRLYPDIFDRMHLFLDWRLGRRSICYTSLSCFSALSIEKQTGNIEQPMNLFFKSFWGKLRHISTSAQRYHLVRHTYVAY